MENLPDGELKNLVKELCQGRELAKQLQIHLNAQSSAHETRDLLIYQILCSYDHALSALEHSSSGAGRAAPITAAVTSDSPRSLAGSPLSDDSDLGSKDQASKRRKAVPRWTQKIKVCTGAGIEGQLDDGYGWRKYGQKDILGAKHPRGYYGCTRRHGQGCLATKQVQRSDKDPTIFEITYRRKHTCNPHANNQPAPAMPDPHNEDPSPSTQNPQKLVFGPQQNQPLFNIQTSYRVITQDDNASFDSFNFPSSSTINLENNHTFSDIGHNTFENYSPNLLSPATTGLDCFPISTNFMDDNYGELFPNLHTSESELCPIVSTITSATSSPTVGTHFSFGSSEFGSIFSFGNPGNYP